MNSRLSVLAGPLSGSEFVLSDVPCSIGRHADNTLCLEDLAVSRRHCLIECVNDEVRLKDLGSRNRTYINGLPVSERRLEHGDEIRIGRSLFLFLADGSSDSRPELLDSIQALTATVVIGPGESRYANPDEFIEHLNTTAGAQARYFRTFLKLGAALPSLRGLAALTARIFDLISEVIPVKRASIFLIEGGSLSSFDRSESDAPPVSKALIDRVLKEGSAICDDGIRLAAPLPGNDEIIGALYLDSPSSADAFDSDVVEFVAGIAGFAARPLETALRLSMLERENRRLHARMNLDHDMVGDSARMKEVYQFIAKAAPTPATVLIRGASGTGKELVARAIHRNSNRSRGPFVAVNCASITETLAESELFGHERGAFTGAVTQKKGKFEEAHGGTLFLDEAGELPAILQVKLLRALQEREFTRVGGNRNVAADVRVVAATNRDLEDAVRQGTFRADLYYRLNVVSMKIPSLSERREDIPQLAEFFVRKYASALGRGPMRLSDPARRALISYDWPGNVRELQNVIERAIVLGSGSDILVEDLPESVTDAAPESGVDAPCAFQVAVRKAKRQIVLDAMERAAGSPSEAARLLGLHPNNLHRLVRTLELKGPARR